MKLDLRFTTRPLEEIWCQAVIYLVFEGPTGEQDIISGLDAKTSGYLSRLRERGFWTGARGDTLLVASQHMIKAERILLKGLGPRGDYTSELIGEGAEEIGTALKRMDVNDIGIRVPVPSGLESEYPKQMETACVHLVKPFLESYPDGPDFLLKMVVSMDKVFMGEIESSVDSFKTHFGSKLHSTIVFEREGGSKSAGKENTRYEI